MITGTIKVNIPARIAFAVASQVDSRVILDQGGAETLLGQGDMLFRPAGTSKLQRIQGAFVTEEEIARLTKHWSRQGEPEFAEELLETRPETADEEGEGELSADQDDLLEEAVRMVVSTQTASVSMIQRRLRVGYTRAGRLIDMLERRGVISGYEGSKPRQVLVSEGELPRVLERLDSPHEDPEPEPVAAREGAGPVESEFLKITVAYGDSARKRRPAPDRGDPRRRPQPAGDRHRDARGADEDRPKYLRALENEDWEGLPGPAYARGFIRAYADEVGIDSEVLVDEYRRRHEAPTGTYEHAEPVLRGGGESVRGGDRFRGV